jgi:hypothetical protein
LGNGEAVAQPTKLQSWKPVISAWMPKSSVQGWQSISLGSGQIKHIGNHQVTIHGLDTGIHAGMTAYLDRQDLCITMSADAWEPSTIHTH